MSDRDDYRVNGFNVNSRGPSEPTPAASGECPVCHYPLNAHHGWPCNTDYATAPPVPVTSGEAYSSETNEAKQPREMRHTAQPAPREFSLRKKKVPTLESDYDTLEILADKEYAGLAGPLFGCIHVVEKSALDAAQAEIERLQKLHLQRTKDASVWLEERDALQAKCSLLEERLSAYQEKRLHADRDEWKAKCERLERDLAGIHTGTRLAALDAMHTIAKDWQEQAERLRETLEVVEPWLPRLSGVIGAISDAALRAQVRKALSEFEKFKRGEE